jgi:hypothetical protein
MIILMRTRLTFPPRISSPIIRQAAVPIGRLSLSPVEVEAEAMILDGTPLKLDRELMVDIWQRFNGGPEK